jgi:hypothetical protein
MPRSTTRRTVAALAIVLSLALAGCGTPPWEEAGASGGSTPIPSPTRITTIVNELANGSTQHELQAGDIRLTVDYYSTLNMGDWTAPANKPLSISMTGVLGTDQGQKIYLSKMTVMVAAFAADGSPLPSPEPLEDRTTVNPGYLVKAPYSYSQTFVLPALDPDTAYVTIALTYELLLQTTPTSIEYAKQTASDNLTIGIAQ